MSSGKPHVLAGDLSLTGTGALGGFPRDQRQYLGNWTTETTADIYTRDKRNVVEKVWKAVGDKMGILKLDNPQAERRIDLNHEDWDDVVDVEDEPRRQLNLDDLDTPMAESSHLADASEGTFKRRKHTHPPPRATAVGA